MSLYRIRPYLLRKNYLEPVPKVGIWQEAKFLLLRTGSKIGKKDIVVQYLNRVGEFWKKDKVMDLISKIQAEDLNCLDRESCLIPDRPKK